jgi:DNA-directed RNA polymerase specialized sigma24 family protein
MRRLSDLSDAETLELLEATLAGDEQAAAEFVRLFGPVVRKAVRRFLGGEVRRMTDSLEVTQSVFREFWATAAEGRRWQRGEDLVGFMIRLGQWKALNTNRRYQCRKRAGDLHAERLRETARQAPLSHEADPLQQALADDEWELILRQAAPEAREILALRRAGYNNAQIAERLGHHVRTIEKALEQARQWYRMHQSGAAH